MRLVDLGPALREYGVKNIDISKGAGVSKKAVSEWRNGKTFPNDDSIHYLISVLGKLTVRIDSGLKLSLVPIIQRNTERQE